MGAGGIQAIPLKLSASCQMETSSSADSASSAVAGSTWGRSRFFFSPDSFITNFLPAIDTDFLQIGF